MTELYCCASSANVAGVWRGMRQPRTTFRMRFTASELTPGRKLVNNRRCLLMAFLGRKVKPRKVNCTFRKDSEQLLSLTYKSFVLSGCNVNLHSANRSAMDRMSCSACCLLLQWTTASSAYRANGQDGLVRFIQTSNA